MTDPTLRFEDLVAARLSGPLRARVQSILRAATALWVVLAGSTDNPMPPALVPRFQAELARLLGRLDTQTATALEAAVAAGLAMGAGHAQRVTGPVATRPTPSVGLFALIREVDRTVRAQIRQARRHVEAIPPVRYQQALAPIAVAQQAANQIDRTARTAVNRAINEGSAAVSRETGAQRVWVPERDACLHCLAYAGLVVGAHEPWPGGLTFYRDPAGHLKPIGHDPVDSPPLHPHCVPAGVVVSGPAVEVGYERRYNGALVEIRTERGHILPATPNHPVLTPQGWVPIGKLDLGSQIFCQAGADRVLGIGPGKYQEPAPIEQVACALRMASGVARVRMPVTTEHFHGDGSNGEVDVVFADGLLRYRAEIGQGCEQVALAGAAGGGALLPGSRGLFQAMRGAGAPLDAALSREGIKLPLFRRFGCSHQPIGVFPAPDLDLRFDERAGDDMSANAEAARELLDAGSSTVLLDRVVEIRRYPFAGQVYNLQTVHGWYSANAIVTHNCRCREQPWLGSRAGVGPVEMPAALQREAQRSVLAGHAMGSEPSRLRAADALLSGRGVKLLVNRTVQQRARRAVAAGRFAQRQRGG